MRRVTLLSLGVLVALALFLGGWTLTTVNSSARPITTVPALAPNGDEGSAAATSPLAAGVALAPVAAIAPAPLAAVAAPGSAPAVMGGAEAALARARSVAQNFAPGAPGAAGLPKSPTRAADVTPTPAPTAAPTAAATASAATSDGEPAEDPLLPSVTVQPGAEPAALDMTDLPKDVTNILVLGSDRRVKSDPGRTDVMMLVSIDRVNKVVRMLSIPRDLWVYLPGVGQNRINTANVFGSLYRKPGGGIGLVKETLKHNLGLRVDRYVMVDFNGFKTVVDTLGGVDVDVPCGIYDAKYLNIGPGRHHMNGELALRYARSRYSTSDFSRAARQQQIIRSLWEQTPKSELLFKIPQLWGTFKDVVETDLSISEMMALGALATQLKPEDIRSKVLTYPNVSAWTTPQGAQVLLLNQAGYKKMVADLFGDASIGANASGKSTVDEDVHGPRVVILNGTARKDLATLAAQSMRDATSIGAAATGTAYVTDYPKTLLLHYGAEPDVVNALSKFYGVEAIKLPATDDPDTPDAVVILGANYQSCRGR